VRNGTATIGILQQYPIRPITHRLTVPLAYRAVNRAVVIVSTVAGMAASTGIAVSNVHLSSLL
jgi:hypothetical protein